MVAPPARSQGPDWLNVLRRHLAFAAVTHLLWEFEAWAYRDIMPVIPVFGAGLSLVLQWVVIPTAAYVRATGLWRQTAAEGVHG